MVVVKAAASEVEAKETEEVGKKAEFLLFGVEIDSGESSIIFVGLGESITVNKDIFGCGCCCVDGDEDE